MRKQVRNQVDYVINYVFNYVITYALNYVINHLRDKLRDELRTQVRTQVRNQLRTVPLRNRSRISASTFYYHIRRSSLQARLKGLIGSSVYKQIAALCYF